MEANVSEKNTLKPAEHGISGAPRDERLFRFGPSCAPKSTQRATCYYRSSTRGSRKIDHTFCPRSLSRSFSLSLAGNPPAINGRATSVSTGITPGWTICRGFVGCVDCCVESVLNHEGTEMRHIIQCNRPAPVLFWRSLYQQLYSQRNRVTD